MLLCALGFFWCDGDAVEVDGDPKPGTREDELGVREDENMVLGYVHQRSRETDHFRRAIGRF
jgi:hypothetical protein